MFTGLLGLSVSLNGGMCRLAPEQVPEPAVSDFQFNPGERRVVNV